MLCVVAHGEGWVVTKSSDGRLFRYVLRGEVSKKKSQARCLEALLSNDRNPHEKRVYRWVGEGNR